MDDVKETVMALLFALIIVIAILATLVGDGNMGLLDLF